MDTEKSLLDHAREYIAKGYSVIPIGEDKKCPISWKEFQTRYATDEELVNWFLMVGTIRAPKIGIVTGKISNLVVVDVDTKIIVDEIRGETPHVSTPRGYHYYYKYPKHFVGNAVGIVPHLDIRGEGGYVVAYPSEGYKIDGNGKEKELFMLPDFPSWMIKLITDALELRRKTESASGVPEQIPDGKRNSTLASLAGSMRKRGMGHDEIYALLCITNEKRCVPPLSVQEIDSIVTSVCRYEQGSLNTKNPNTGQASKSVDSNGNTGNNPVPEHSLSVVSFSEIKDVVFEDLEKIQTTIPVLDRYMSGGLGLTELSLVIAEHGTGKTTLGCFVGAQAVNQGYDVLHVFYEDPIQSIRERYSANLSPDRIAEAYLADAGSSPASLSKIEQQVEKHEPGLVIIDYLARVPAVQGLAESRFEIRDILMKFANIARTYNCHVMLMDHVTIVNKQFNKTYKMSDDRLSEAKMFKGMVVSIMLGMMVDTVNPDMLYFTGMKMKRAKGCELFHAIRVDRTLGRFYQT